jgi:putative hemolysin
MTAFLILGALAIATAGSLFFSGLTYSLRDFARPRLQEEMEKRGHAKLYDIISDHAGDLVFLTAVLRMIFNVLVVVCVLALTERSGYSRTTQYLWTVLLGAIVSLFASIALPSAIANYAGEPMIAALAPALNAMRVALSPLTKLMHSIDNMAKRAARTGDETDTEIIEQEIEQEIMSVVEEGEKEGVVDETEREMIHSVIEFRDTTAGQIMTSRPEIVALENSAKLSEVKDLLEETGHSRLPVYEGTLDKIVGILYARDLLKYLGLPPGAFDIRTAVRPAFYVPDTKPLKDLLRDFRLQKVHIAIVLDEYGGTAGLVTIEDILEELVGEIADEHETVEPAMLQQISENVWEADARVYVDELNRVVGLNLPEDAGYDTLAGFVTTTLGRIPATGATFDQPSKDDKPPGAKFTILDAEPQKVNRVRIELTQAPVAEEPKSELG